jgi:hypothetical protein
MPKEQVKKMFNEGKITQIPGVKAGKLDKKMIDPEPPIEKSAGWKPGI